MLVQKRYCDYDYDSNMIILFDPLDEERRQDDQLDIYWISCGNEKIEDVPLPQTRILSPKKKKKKSTASTAATATARVVVPQKAKVVQTQPETMMKSKKTKMVQMQQKAKMKAIPRSSKSAAPMTVNKPYSAVPDARCVPTPWAPPIGTPYATATTGGYGQFPAPMNNAHYAIPTGPAGPYYPY